LPKQANLATYRINSATKKTLDDFVDAIEADPGDLISPHEFNDCGSAMDLKAVMTELPAGVSEDDFIGILRLALLTECATESYANLISAIGRDCDASWLSRFTERVWAPDEITHHTPYRYMLLSLGFSEEELDRDIAEVQAKPYMHTGGYSPVEITTFGMVQEYLTDNYHGLIAAALKKGAPEAASMVYRVKRRETLHMAWYRDMTAIQVEENPRFVEDMTREIISFDMPGASLIPDLQAQGKRWQMLLGANPERMFRDLIRLVHEVLGNTRLTGELVLRLAADRNVAIGPLSARQISGALNRLGGVGHGLIGEALLEKAGLGYMFNRPEGTQDRGFRPYQGVQAQVRTLIRSWICSHIPSPSAVMLTAG